MKLLRWLKRQFQTRPLHEGELRLHLGCGQEYWDGYINIDADPRAHADLHIDFTQIREHFSNGSIGEVVMIHSLSYLRLWEARDLLADIHRILRPGARLIIELPDLAKCAKWALESEGKESDYLEAVRGLYAFGMDHITERFRYTPYAFGWSSWHLKQELERAGFKQVTVEIPRTHDTSGRRDTRLEALK